MRKSKTSPLLLCDFYKTTHVHQYPKGVSRLWSYDIARTSRLADQQFLICFGVQAFVREYRCVTFVHNTKNVA